MLKNEKGMTLLELLIAVAILALIAGPYFSQFVTSVKIGERSERIVRAEFVAQAVLEEEKQNIKIPEDGKPREDVKDDFRVVVSYENHSDDINTSDGTLEFYEGDVESDYILVPLVKSSGTDVQFRKKSNTSYATASGIAQAGLLTIYLESTPIDSQYELHYQIGDGNKTKLPGSMTKTADEVVNLKFQAPQDTKPEDALPNTTLINVNLINNTEGEKERLLQLHEFDDEYRNFNFSTDNSSSGEVTLFLKLTSDVAVNVNDKQGYYWVHIEVFDSADELMAELHSAVREE